MDYEAGIPPHGELEQLAEAGHIEWGIYLYRCRQCRAWWEFETWTYFPHHWLLRRVRPVAALDRWTAKQRRGMQPRSLLPVLPGLLVGGLLILAITNPETGWRTKAIVTAVLLAVWWLLDRALRPRKPARPSQGTKDAEPDAAADRPGD